MKNIIKGGDKWYNLTIESIERTYGRRYRGVSIINCICDCGKRVSFRQEVFIKKRNCGCKKGNTKYKKLDKKTYSSWRNMKIRCLCKSNESYKKYGAFGIKICDGLLIFDNFQELLGLPPSKLHTVDRIDNDLNYSCGECQCCKENGWKMNVRWATKKQQSSNRNICYDVIVDGILMTLKDACVIKGLPYKQIHERVKRGGWDINIAINTPVIKGTNIRYKKLINDKISTS